MNEINVDDFSQIKHLMELDSEEELVMYEDMGRIFIHGQECELMLRLVSFNKTITIARIGVKNKRRKVATSILEQLKIYAKNNGYDFIKLESTITKEINRFAEHHKFIPVEHEYSVIDGECYGNYLLKLQ